MKHIRGIALGFVVLTAALAAAPAHAGHGHGSWSIGVRFGAPACYRPWPSYHPYYYRPYPVYVAPAPVIVRPVPVIQEVPVIQTPVYEAPMPRPLPTPASATEESAPAVEHHLQMLSHADEHVRADSALQLGRLKAKRAVDPLAASLAGDRSAKVRDAAARALGLIGLTQGMPALQRAAQVDADPEVRRSAQYAMEVIQSRN